MLTGRRGNGESHELHGSVGSIHSTTLHISAQLLKKEIATYAPGPKGGALAWGMDGSVILTGPSLTDDCCALHPPS